MFWPLFCPIDRRYSARWGLALDCEFAVIPLAVAIVRE